MSLAIITRTGQQIYEAGQKHSLLSNLKYANVIRLLLFQTLRFIHRNDNELLCLRLRARVHVRSNVFSVIYYTRCRYGSVARTRTTYDYQVPPDVILLNLVSHRTFVIPSSG